MKQYKISIKDAKEKNLWAVINIDSLPEKSPVIGISRYASKEMAKFNLVTEVIVPNPITLEELTTLRAQLEEARKDVRMLRGQLSKTADEKEQWITDCNYHVSKRLELQKENAALKKEVEEMKREKYVGGNSLPGIDMSKVIKSDPQYIREDGKIMKNRKGLSDVQIDRLFKSISESSRDEFAMKFAEWAEDKDLIRGGTTKWFCRYAPSKYDNLTTQDLLNQFKNEK